jgi:outer membrane protein TolC
MRDRSGQGLSAAAALAMAEGEFAQSEAQVVAAELQIRVTRAALARVTGR